MYIVGMDITMVTSFIESLRASWCRLEIPQVKYISIILAFIAVNSCTVLHNPQLHVDSFRKMFVLDNKKIEVVLPPSLQHILV